jgi:hypothetical protein
MFWSRSRGVVSVAAAGNSAYDLSNKTVDNGSPNDQDVPVRRTINAGCHDIPTELPGVVTVASMQRFPANTMDSRLSSFSNRGLGVIDVAAPGSSILSTIVRDNGWGLKSGTSMASPHVAGVLASWVVQSRRCPAATRPPPPQQPLPVPVRLRVGEFVTGTRVSEPSRCTGRTHGQECRWRGTSTSS